MAKIKEEKRGHNVRLVLTWKNMTHETLVDKLDIYQTDISNLEQKETIDDKILNDIVKAMNIPR